MRRMIWMLLLVSCFPLESYGQDALIKSRTSENFSPSSLLASAKTRTFTFLDPAKFSMSHSYTMGFLSGGNGSSAQGLYRNTIRYQASANLHLQVKIGVERTLFNSSPGLSGSRPTRVLPGFDLLYRPSDRFSIHVGVDTGNAYGLNSGYPAGFGFLERDQRFGVEQAPGDIRD